MAASVSRWNPEGLPYAEAVQLSKAQVAAYREAASGHVFSGCLDGLSDESYEASRTPRWVGTEKRFANGVHRIVVRKVHPNPQSTLDRAVQRDLGLPTGLEVDRDAEQWRKRNARRARAQVVDKAIAAGMNALHTLTFKHNVTDLDEALRCFDLYRRKCQKLLPGWRYVVCWQRQERGAWHFHLATYRLPRHFTQSGVKVNSWDVMRRLWLQSAGEYGGNFDEAREKRRNGSRVPFKSAARIARYIGRYIGRDIGEPDQALKGRKSFATSKGIELPVPQRYLWDGDETGRWGELMTWALERLGAQSYSCWFSRDLEVFFVESQCAAGASVPAS